MSPGQPSPCEGLLIPTEDARECLHATRVALPTCEADLGHTDGVLRAERVAYRQQLAAQLAQAERLEGLLADVTGPARWYEDPTTAFVVGFVVASAAAVTLHVMR